LQHLNPPSTPLKNYERRVMATALRTLEKSAARKIANEACNAGGLCSDLSSHSGTRNTAEPKMNPIYDENARVNLLSAAS
jgi:hypothetical protein